jgi:hypothetical protein
MKICVVKLWAYVKYMNSRVTALDVDWDAAFAEASSTAAETATDRDFEAAIAQMLSALKDPMTRIVPTTQELIGDQTRVVSTLTREDGVTVVRLESGDMQRAMQMRKVSTGVSRPRLPNRMPTTSCHLARG